MGLLDPWEQRKCKDQEDKVEGCKLNSVRVVTLSNGPRALWLCGVASADF